MWLTFGSEREIGRYLPAMDSQCLLSSSSGQERMIAELTAASDLFSSLDEELTSIGSYYASRFGVTDDVIEEELRALRDE